MEITEPGNYVLNKNIFISESATEGISINTNDVSLDLNGYSISSNGSGIAIKIFGRGISIHNGQISDVDIAFLFVTGYNVKINNIIVSNTNKVLSGLHVENLNVNNLTATIVKKVFIDVKHLVSPSLNHLNVADARIFAVLSEARVFSLKNSQINLLNPGIFVSTSTTESIVIDIQIENNRVAGGLNDQLHDFFSLKGTSPLPVKALIQNNFFNIIGTFNFPSISIPIVFQTGFNFENVSAPKTIIFKRNVLTASNITIGFVSSGNSTPHAPPTNDSISISDNEFYLSKLYIGIILASYEASQDTSQPLPLPFSLDISNNKVLGADENSDVQTSRNAGIAVEFVTGANISNNEISSFINGIVVHANTTFLNANTISNCYVGINNFSAEATFGRENKIFNCKTDVFGQTPTYLADIPSSSSTTKSQTNLRESNKFLTSNLYIKEK